MSSIAGELVTETLENGGGHGVCPARPACGSRVRR